MHSLSIDSARDKRPLHQEGILSCSDNGCQNNGNLNHPFYVSAINAFVLRSRFSPLQSHG
jgi:hypothetical protein